MTSTAILILQAIFTTIWRFFVSWYIPGTHTTPAAWFLFVAVTGICIRFIQRVTFAHTVSVGNRSDDQ